MHTDTLSPASATLLLSNLYLFADASPNKPSWCFYKSHCKCIAPKHSVYMCIPTEHLCKSRPLPRAHIPYGLHLLIAWAFSPFTETKTWNPLFVESQLGSPQIVIVCLQEAASVVNVAKCPNCSHVTMGNGALVVTLRTNHQSFFFQYLCNFEPLTIRFLPVVKKSPSLVASHLAWLCGDILSISSKTEAVPSESLSQPFVS